MIKKILILSANPKTTPRLSLDEEVREIEECLKRAKQREKFDIKSRWAVRYSDLQRALLDYEPQIVHFSGHGEKGGLMLEDDFGIGEVISSEVISGLFKLCSDHAECVILNACDSAPQAAAIKKHINYVIGMPNKIKDKAAIEFSVNFYDALGAGKTIEKAFNFGCLAFRRLKIPKKFDPRLYKKKSTQFPQEEQNDIGTENTGSPTTPTTQPLEPQSSLAPIINAKNIGKINYTPKGDIHNTETNYNYYPDQKEEK
jgi:hypothetical protein